MTPKQTCENRDREMRRELIADFRSPHFWSGFRKGYSQGCVLGGAVAVLAGMFAGRPDIAICGAVLLLLAAITMHTLTK